MNNMKKLLALLLAVVMVLGMFPMGAMAEETEPELCTCGLVLNHDGECQSQEPAPQNLEEPELCTCGLAKGHDGECKTAEPEYCDCGLTKGHEGECKTAEPEYCDCGLAKGHEGDCKTAEPEYCDCGLEKGHEGDCKTAEPEYCDCGLTKGHEGECQKVEQTKCGICGGEHKDDACTYCLLCKTDRSNCVICEECESHAGDHRVDCSKAKKPDMATPPEEDSLYDILMATDSVEAMYQVVLEYMFTEPDTLRALTEEEILALLAYIDELDPEQDDTDYVDLVDTLTYLPAMECPECGEYGGHADDCVRNIQELPDMSGTVGATTISSDTRWNLKGDITLTGTIRIKSGAKLGIFGVATIKRADGFTGDMFYVESNGTLQINGEGPGGMVNGNWDAKNSIYVDGNSKITATGQIIDCSGRLSLRDTVICNNKGSSAIWVGGDGKGAKYDDSHKTTVEITRTLIQDHDAQGGAGLFIAGTTPADYTIDIWKSKFYNCVAVDASAICLSSSGQATVTMRNSIVQNCDTVDRDIKDTYGGAIRTNGNGKYKLTMTDCVVRECDSWHLGGGVYWNANGEGAKLTIKDCHIFKNTAVEMGGGIFLEGNKIEIVSSSLPSETDTVFTGAIPSILNSTIIEDNYAKIGGGINFKCYQNDPSIQTNGTVMTFGQNVVVRNNDANYGAGLALHYVASENYKQNSTFITNVNGTVFYGNDATISGGAIYIEKGRKDYITETNINSATIYNNTASNNAGALCVTAASSLLGTTMNPDVVNIGTSGGTNNDVVIRNNRSVNGGAVYVSNGEVNLYHANITKNTANNGNGGALYAASGEVNIMGGSMTENTGVNGAGMYVNGTVNMSGGEIVSNTASRNGGAAYVSGGDVTISGGSVTNNTALNGGAAYVTGGNFNISGGDMTKNNATNGGAVYADGGEVMIAHGSLNENEATKGGAIYMAGTSEAAGKLTMESGEMKKNHAADDGGAIYAEYGVITIGLQYCVGLDDNRLHTAKGAGRHHPLIQENKAEDCGGGIAIANEGEVRFYCGSIDPNEALYKGVGNNVFMQGGNFYLYSGAKVGTPGDPDLVIVGGEIHNESATDARIVIQYYKTNTATSHDKVGFGEENQWMNLPDAEYFWDADEGYRFFGWTPYGGVSAITEVRNKNQYKESGTPVKITDDATTGAAQGTYDGTADNTMHLYALWAPEVSSITYVDGLTFDVIDNKEPDVYNIRETTYTLEIDRVLKPGYILTGWYIYQNLNQNANWSDAEDSYEPVYENGYVPTYTGSVTPANDSKDNYQKLDFEQLQFIPANANEVATLNVDALTFGDITLIAKFEPAYTSLRITKSGWNSSDANQSFIFNISGQPSNSKLPYVNMNVVIHGDGNVLLAELPVGNYTVKEVSNWSWRYGTTTVAQGTNGKFGTAASGTQCTVTATDPTVEYGVKFTNTRTKTQWLDGDSWCLNRVVNNEFKQVGKSN